MHSICYVILPDHTENKEQYVKEVLAPYNSELEVPPYRHFLSKEITLRSMEKSRCKTLDEYAEFLRQHEADAGIENGLCFFWLTINPNGHWDYYVLERTDTITEKTPAPFSLITPQGLWKDKFDFDYKPILDFKNNTEHPDNMDAQKKWKLFWEKCRKEYQGKPYYILNIHS